MKIRLLRTNPVVFQFLLLSLDPQQLYGVEGTKTESQILYIGNCTTEHDPASDVFQDNARFCTQGQFGSEAILASNSTKNGFVSHGTLYAGIHPNEFISGHLGALGYAASYSNKTTAETRLFGLRQALLILGNSSVYNLRLSIGYQIIAFGINHNPFFEHYELIPQTTLVQTFGVPAITVTWDNLFDFQIDLSLSQSGAGLRTEPRKNETFEPANNHAVSIRTMFDVSSLQGTRFVFSLEGNSSSDRKFGTALINASQKGDITQIEWIRSDSYADDQTEEFAQLIRLSFTGSKRSRNRWNFLYDHVRHSHQATTLGNTIRMGDVLELKFSLGYISYNRNFKNQDETDHSVFTIGIQTSL